MVVRQVNKKNPWLSGSTVTMTNCQERKTLHLSLPTLGRKDQVTFIIVVLVLTATKHVQH